MTSTRAQKIRKTRYPELDVSKPRHVSTWRSTYDQLTDIASCHNVSISCLIQMLVDFYNKALEEINER